MKATTDPVEQFWSVVEHCLVRFHQKPRKAAHALACDFKREIEGSRSKKLFYHAEPFDIACDLAAHDLDVDDHREEYVALRDAIFFPESARGASARKRA